jgi:Holliday junction resolvase RusA-like endonuclease
MRIRINGTPYGQLKSRGRKDGCAEWTRAVVEQTRELDRVSGACTVDVTFFLPADKYPLDHPFGSDLDNLLKRFFDALQQTVLADAPGKDGCVVELAARKRKASSAEPPGALLTISSTVA